MRITILHGSPKGELSVTAQYAEYLTVKFPDHEWNHIHIGSEIGKIEKDTGRFREILAEVKRCDIVMWCYPVYHLLVPSQLKRFIEMAFESGADAFKGKYAAVLMTSIHYYDHTSRNYIHAVSEDLGMNFAGAYSAEMNDLLDADKRSTLESFAGNIISDASAKRAFPRSFPEIRRSEFQYVAGAVGQKIDITGLRVRAIADLSSGGNVRAMADRLASRFGDGFEIVDISSISIKSGCSGCCNCGFDNECIYDNADDFRKCFDRMIGDADVIFMIGGLRDRYLSSVFKKFFDRTFVYNHAPKYKDKQICWIISGELSQTPNIKQIIEAYADVSRGNLTGIVSDEARDSKLIDSQIDSLAERAIILARTKYIAPQTFLGVGGMKIFRDEIWGQMRIFFHQDYRVYRIMRFFDFPQKKRFARTLVPLAALIVRIPALKKIMKREMKRGMVGRHVKTVEAAKKQVIK